MLVRDWMKKAGFACLLAALPLTAVNAVTPDEDDDDDELKFEETFIFFELNDTDGDLGIHGKVDGDEWKRIRIEDPNERVIMRVRAAGKLRRHGITELFFESAEPTFDELDPAKFFKRFPAGEYEVEGITVDGEEIEGEWTVSHVIPAAPVAIVVGAESPEYDEEEEEFGCWTLDSDLDDVVIAWSTDISHHAELGIPGEVSVVNFEVVVEVDETPWNSSIILPPEATEYEVSDEILDLADEIKFEVLVRADSYNQTAMESCFEWEDDEE